MGLIRFGPARVPSRESPDEAVALLVERGFTACEIDFAGGFWMKPEKEWASAFGEAARAADIVLSVHAPLPAFLGQPDAGKHKRSVGMLDHTAGVAVACGAEIVVFHPGFLLGRTHEESIDSVVEQLAPFRTRLEEKERVVAFGVEVMGRVRDFGTVDDVLAISSRAPWVRPVIDFAHLHAVTDGAYTDADAFAATLSGVDAVLEDGAPFHIHFSDIAYAKATTASGAPGGNEKHHLPYGEGTLRAEPLRDALARFERPATVISESPDHESDQAIRAILVGASP